MRERRRRMEDCPGVPTTGSPSGCRLRRTAGSAGSQDLPVRSSVDCEPVFVSQQRGSPHGGVRFSLGLFRKGKRAKATVFLPPPQARDVFNRVALIAEFATAGFIAQREYALF